MKKPIVFIIGLIAAIYLFNPGSGLFELIPDNLPLLGNLDEAAAMALLLACLRYFGIVLTRFFRDALKP
ncbi:MAG: DUF1232 domain-containing protein [Desulfuromonadaceae bacterium]